MASWIRFKDQLSTGLGVYVTEYPPVTIPEERAEFKPVPGRSGTLTLLEGDAVYEDITLAVGCYTQDLSRLSEISMWLRGSGNLTLGSDPDRCYRARAVNQIELTKLVRGRSARAFDAVFRCKPFRYEANPEPYRLTAPTIIPGEGSVPAAPVITVLGTGNVTLTVGDRSVSLDGMAGSVTIDCDAMTAYHTGAPDAKVSITLLDRDWPQLSTDITRVSWSGDVRMMTIDANWRWL